MNGSLIALAMFIFAVFFAGCSRQLPATSTSSTTKVGQTTKSGQIVELSGKLYLQESGQSPLEIDSYNVDLKSNVGKTVTVTGEYSGNTLFVGKLE